MPSFIRNPKDFWTALIYIAIGLSAIFLARDYGMGTALRMGPGYFPSVLAGALTLIGIVSLFRSFIRRGEPVGTFALRAMALVLGATLLTGFLVRNAGLAIALPLLVLISSYASIKFRFPSALALAVGLTVFCVLVFVKGLGIPLPVLGAWFGG
ncbi:MAG: tripartite tricarboxylate transporter TctB family protein [Burkholderiales bacterium]|nr:tripartite tricarboxylate transporter TctB family protein [Burkholderiales bacterium]